MKYADTMIMTLTPTPTKYVALLTGLPIYAPEAWAKHLKSWRDCERSNEP